MHTIILAALIAATIQAPIPATTPGYDRPTASNGHEHVVYWTSFFDGMDIDPQVAADAKNVDDLHTKPKPKK